MSIKKVMVVGSGLMGSGITQMCAQAGIVVFINDISQDALEKAMENIKWSVGKFIEKGQLEEDRETILNRITIAKVIDAAAEVDLVIEAVFEKIEIKKDIFKKLDRNLLSGSVDCKQHLCDSGYRTCVCHHKARKVSRASFFQPGTDDEGC